MCTKQDRAGLPFNVFHHCVGKLHANFTAKFTLYLKEPCWLLAGLTHVPPYSLSSLVRLNKRTNQQPAAVDEGSRYNNENAPPRHENKIK